MFTHANDMSVLSQTDSTISANAWRYQYIWVYGGFFWVGQIDGTGIGNIFIIVLLSLMCSKSNQSTCARIIFVPSCTSTRVIRNHRANGNGSLQCCVVLLVQHWIVRRNYEKNHANSLMLYRTSFPVNITAENVATIVVSCNTIHAQHSINSFNSSFPTVVLRILRCI